MDEDWIDVERMEGAKQIQEYCRQVAKDLSLELISANWSNDLVQEHEKYILTIKAQASASARPASGRARLRDQSAEPDITEIRFSLEEIAGYSAGKGTEATNVRIQRELAK